MSDENDFRPLDILAERLRTRIGSEGPISVAAFMSEALFDPMAGFYATKDPLGAANDFITAPEISQMFGELIGLWAAEVWGQMGAPETFQLVELGPGTGRMMSDVLRAGRAAPGFVEAAQIHLVEASAALKMVQGQTLAQSPAPVRWQRRLEDVPEGPCIIISNEFLDCLPIRQAICHKGQWHERVVGLKEDDFAFLLGGVLSTVDIEDLPPELRDADDGQLVELRPADVPLMAHIAERFKSAPGYSLFVDYGADRPVFGDTLQAIRKHQKVDPMDQPGSADLTSWAFFDRLGALGLQNGLQVFGPMRQGDFLIGLGIEQRAAMLAQKLDAAGQAKLARQLERLVSAKEMGELFKVMGFASPDLPPAPGLNLFTV
jgi:SAM-dependent MidA family methyltransferase